MSDGLLYIPSVKKLRKVVLIDDLIKELLPVTAKVVEKSRYDPETMIVQGQWSKQRDESIVVYTPKEGYHSIFRLNADSLKAYMDEHDGSLSGYTPDYTNDGVYGSWFIIDFDLKEQPLTEILRRVHPLMMFLYEKEVEHYLFSSGNKGVHLYIPFAYFDYPTSFNNRMHEVASACCSIIKEQFDFEQYDTKGISPSFFVDPSIYLPMSFIRAPYSLNQKGNKPKILLDYHYDLSGVSERNKTSDYVTPVVLHKQEIEIMLRKFNTEYNPSVEKIWKVTPVEKSFVARDDRDIIFDKWIPKFGDEYCIFAMLNDPTPSQRHNTGLRIGGWLYNKGMPRDTAYDIIFNWNNNLDKPMEDKEIEILMRHYGKYYWSCSDPLKMGYCPKNHKCAHWKTQELLGNIYDSKQAMQKTEEYLKRDESFDIDLDNIFPGYKTTLIPAEGHIVTIGAAPGVGKSFIALNMALKVECGVLFFSNEMSIYTIQKRVARMLNLNIHDPEDRKMIVHCTKHIFVEDLGTTPLDRHIEIKHGIEAKYGIRIGLVIVDYLQITKVYEPNSKTRVIEDPRKSAMQIATVAKLYSKTDQFIYCFLSQLPGAKQGNGNSFVDSECLKDSQSINNLNGAL